MVMKKAHINITIDEDLNEWADKKAAELGINKSQFVNNVLSVTRDDVKIFKAIGLFELAKAAKRLKEECLKAGVRFKGISLKSGKRKTA